jgi:DNA-binding transcriptional regulator YbjK
MGARSTISAILQSMAAHQLRPDSNHSHELSSCYAAATARPVLPILREPQMDRAQDTVGPQLQRAQHKAAEVEGTG